MHYLLEWVCIGGRNYKTPLRLEAHFSLALHLRMAQEEQLLSSVQEANHNGGFEKIKEKRKAKWYNCMSLLFIAF